MRNESCVRMEAHMFCTQRLKTLHCVNCRLLCPGRPQAASEGEKKAAAAVRSKQAAGSISDGY